MCRYYSKNVLLSLQGSYCPTGSSFPTPCPAGYFGNETGVKRSVECTECPGGEYCAGVGKTAPTGLCDAGFYCIRGAWTSV